VNIGREFGGGVSNEKGAASFGKGRFYGLLFSSSLSL